MRCKPQIEALEARDCPAAGVVGSLSAGVLFVNGTNNADQILISANAGGQILLNGQSVAGATRDSVGLIVVQAGAGNDFITLDRSLNTVDANGVLLRSPDAQLFGGKGNDTFNLLNGGIVGGLAGVINGVVVGPVVGNTYAEGGAGDDLFISGFGEDFFLGQGGNDTFIWNPGTIDDRFDGGAGYDTATIIGNNGVGDTFTLGNINGQLVFQRTNLVNFSVIMDNVERVNLDPGAGGGDIVTIGDLGGTGVREVNVFVDDLADIVSVAPQRRGIDVDVLSVSF